jgi:hypothetical protein
VLGFIVHGTEKLILDSIMVATKVWWYDAVYDEWWLYTCILYWIDDWMHAYIYMMDWLWHDVCDMKSSCI